MLGACDDFLDIGSDLHDDGAFVRRRFISSWRREGVVVVVVDDENESKGCTARVARHVWKLADSAHTLGLTSLPLFRAKAGSARL